jgi:glycosyltransferase involved in cell wall biosynthesis
VEEVNCDSQDELWAAVDRSCAEDINISFVSLPIHDHFRGTNIQWVVFESTRVPPTVMSTMLASDQVWVPSAWGREVLIANGADPDRCHVVPEGVDSNQFHAYGASRDSSVLRYLITGKYEIRKSIIETVFAWHQEFGNDPGVELTVKTDHFVNREHKHNEITQWIQKQGISNIRVVWGAVPADQLVDLYRQADIFVLPSKGEGWGLPLIEAAAAGLPIITTMHSAHTEFLQHIQSSVIPVEFDMVPVACPEYQYFYPAPDNNWGKWAQPRIDSIRQALTSARQNYPTLQEQARANSTVIRTQFSWAQSAEAALQRLQAHGLLL